MVRDTICSEWNPEPVAPTPALDNAAEPHATTSDSIRSAGP